MAVSGPDNPSGHHSLSAPRTGRGLLNHVGDLRRAKPALIFATLVWPLFAVLDVLHVWIANEWERLPLLLFLRVLPVPWFALAAYRVQKRPPISGREFTVLVYGAIWAPLAVVALQCLATGGLPSDYATANLVVLASSMMVPRPWRSHGPLMAIGGLFYPLGMIAGALALPSMRAQLSDPTALHPFVFQLTMHWAAMAMVVLGSHRLWSLRREIFRARNIGKYELRRRIGKGGMGEVWAAWHKGLEREVALKILRLADHSDPVAAARFEREVRLSSGLTHPNTVRVFDFGTTEDGLLYYAMELLDGSSLGEIVKTTGPMPAPRAAHLILQAARALAEAHSLGIVHRDVKPENIFVTSAGGQSDFVKVLDFGIARVEEENIGLTQTGTVAGTPVTISPEVIEGSPAVPASDVYGLGAVLYIALTGAAPFAGDSAATTMLMHLNDPVVPPSSRTKNDIPPELERVVLRALEKRPEDRYLDARAFAEALAGTQIAAAWIPEAVPSARARGTIPPALRSDPNLRRSDPGVSRTDRTAVDLTTQTTPAAGLASGETSTEKTSENITSIARPNLRS